MATYVFERRRARQCLKSVSIRKCSGLLRALVTIGTIEVRLLESVCKLAPRNVVHRDAEHISHPTFGHL